MPFQNMSTLVVFTIILASVSAAPSLSTHATMKNSVSKVGIINPVVFVISVRLKQDFQAQYILLKELPLPANLAENEQ